MTDTTISLTVNGEPVRVQVPARINLADMLREHLRLTGTHLGCEQGVCGACTVLVDDLPMRACLMLAASCDGADVRTVEGLDDADAERLRAAFAREGALQCGFCTPGMLIAGYDLVRQRAELTRDELCVAMSGNICRCTGYNGIVRAITAAIDEATHADATVAWTHPA